MGRAARARAQAKAEGRTLPGHNPDAPAFTARFLANDDFLRARAERPEAAIRVSFNDRKYLVDEHGTFRRTSST